MTPMRAVILSCTFEAMNSESERGFPMVKLRRRSNSMFSLSASKPYRGTKFVSSQSLVTDRGNEIKTRQKTRQ